MALTRETHLIVMGVSGCGKSTLGAFVASQLGRDFFDADDYHPSANLEKMVAGEPLTDEDREPWLVQLNRLLYESQPPGAVLACSALKQQYREWLTANIKAQFLYLAVTPAVVRQRLAQRENHFMPRSLIDSQFATLEEPTGAIEIDADQPLAEVQNAILKSLAI